MFRVSINWEFEFHPDQDCSYFDRQDVDFFDTSPVFVEPEPQYTADEISDLYFYDALAACLNESPAPGYLLK